MDYEKIIRALRDTAQSTSNTVAETAAFPVDMIAMALRKAGVPGQDNAVGGSDWMKKNGIICAVEPGAAKVVGETLGNVIPAMAVAKMQQTTGKAIKAAK